MRHILFARQANKEENLNRMFILLFSHSPFQVHTQYGIINVMNRNELGFEMEIK